jgi:glycosyltransferase involved in cell wall biosynthesis
MKRKLLIVTLNDYIIYQPTILNLYDALISHFDVTVISFEPEFISTKKDDTRNIVYLKTNFFWQEFFQKSDFVVSRAIKFIKPLLQGLTHHYFYYNYYLPRVLKRKLKSLSSDVVIAVDIPALHVAQEVFGAVHFLSLEIDTSIPHFRNINVDKIRSVLIQSPTRYQRLFNDKEIKTFYVQNSPAVGETYRASFERKDFVWAGTFLERFGIMDCLDFFKHFPQHHLVIKGGADKKTMAKIRERYGELIASGRIHINQDYLPADQFIEFLSMFRIGFCFYSWELIKESFNYQTAPSGKLFMYLAAGTPVIACNIPGFSFVQEFGVGVLIEDYKPETIESAAIQIENNFQRYSENCYKAAKYFDFTDAVRPYVQYLVSQQ